MQPPVHLSLAVPDIERSVEFFQLLGGAVTHRDPSGYVNLAVRGVQLTLASGNAATDAELHFGWNVTLAEFEAIAQRLLSSPHAQVIAPPRVVDAGTPLERTKMYVRCPAGYVIELKGYRE